MFRRCIIDPDLEKLAALRGVVLTTESLKKVEGLRSAILDEIDRKIISICFEQKNAKGGSHE
jgi:hypothetical protein